jgi:ribosomal protein S18 acetylase RimI-like enzyme
VSKIRAMREEDADDVRKVDAVAFGTWWQQQTGQPVPVPQRTQTNVLACREKDPEGCFVAEEGGRVVGFIFSRTWGGVGWFGTFAVLPEYQGRGLGKRLVGFSLEYLRREPHRVIGLETMAESEYNLGLYLRQGFRACLPTFSFSKPISQPTADHAGLAHWSVANAETRVRWLADLRVASEQIRPGLDYSKEILSTAEHELGETLVLCEGSQAVGFSTVWLVSSREGWGDEFASIQAMALHPAHSREDALHALLHGSEALASTQGKETLVVPVNARQTWALERLLAQGYRVSRAMMRMVLKGTEVERADDRHVDFSRWAG